MNKAKLILFFLCCLTFVSCKAKADTPNENTIIATLFPQYDFTRQIVGDTANVKLLLPPGVESHTFEPTSNDMADINQADLFVFTGQEMEPWAASLIKDKSEQLTIVNLSENIDLDEASHTHDDSIEHSDEIINSEDDTNEHEHALDPHIWLDLSYAEQMVNTLCNSLVEKFPENSELYKSNAQKLVAQLRTLDNEFKQVIDNAEKDTIVFGGRFAYAHFLNHYGLKYETVYDNCSSEAEPSVSRVADIVDYITKNEIKFVYHEEFVNPKVANSICEQTGATPLLFSTCHNVTKEDMLNNITFVQLMQQNLKNLKLGLSS